MNSARYLRYAKGLLMTAVLFGVLIGLPTYAHEGEVHEEEIVVQYPEIPLDIQIIDYSLKAIIVSSVIVAFFTIISLSKNFMGEGYRKFAFIMMVVPTSLTTLFMAGSTVYLNQVSSSGGPVHWHADFLIDYCGQPVDLKDPKGLSNRIGTPVLHEHGDNRIHVEGVVLEHGDVTLKRFFQVIGGRMQSDLIIFPTDNGPLLVKNGEVCPGDTSNREGKWQVFVYKTNPETNIVRQEKLIDFPDYILSPYGVVPPADCIIFEFTGENKDRTDKICGFYEIELNKGEIKMQQ